MTVQVVGYLTDCHAGRYQNKIHGVILVIFLHSYGGLRKAGSVA